MFPIIKKGVRRGESHGRHKETSQKRGLVINKG